MSSCCRSARTRVSDVFLTVLCCEKSAWRTCHDSVQMNAGQAETVNHHMAPLDGLPDRCDLLQQGEGAITHLSRRDQSEGSLARSAGKKKKGAYFYLVSRHFVPGYFNLVPPGQDPLFRCKIFLKSALTPLRSCAVAPRTETRFPARNMSAIGLVLSSEGSPQCRFLVKEDKQVHSQPAKYCICEDANVT